MGIIYVFVLFFLSSINDEVILMSTHNIHFHDKTGKKNHKIFLNVYFLELSLEFPREFKLNSN